jgi:hypothetical protein
LDQKGSGPWKNGFSSKFKYLKAGKGPENPTGMGPTKDKQEREVSKGKRGGGEIGRKRSVSAE